MAELRIGTPTEGYVVYVEDDALRFSYLSFVSPIKAAMGRLADIREMLETRAAGTARVYPDKPSVEK